MSNSIETPIPATLKEIKIENWPELRRQNVRDFEVNLKPLFERLDEWRKNSAVGRPTPNRRPDQKPSF